MDSVMKVLVVDDDQEVLNLITEEFNYKGYVVLTASSGNEAIETLKRDTFDVIVSDFQMPNGCGMSILNFINSMKNRPVFIFFSGQTSVSIEFFKNAGANEYFAKPFDLELLVSELEKISALRFI